MSMSRTITQAEAARLMNVSVSALRLGEELIRCDRPDLVREVEAGRMRLYRALCIALPAKYGRKVGALPALQGIWNAATRADRDEFVVWIAE